MRTKVDTLLYLVLLVASVVGICSCDDARTYDHYESIMMSGWERNDTASFTVPRQWEGYYSLELGIRATMEYPYKNISLIMEGKIIPDKKKAAYRTFQDTITCNIIDDNGRLVGKRGISNTEIMRFTTGLNINRGDSLYVTVRHIMSREQLPGISDVGIRLTKIR